MWLHPLLLLPFQPIQYHGHRNGRALFHPFDDVMGLIAIDTAYDFSLEDFRVSSEGVVREEGGREGGREGERDKFLTNPLSFHLLCYFLL